MKRLKQSVKRVRPLLGTYVEITLRGSAPAETLHAWVTAGFETVEEIDRLMSFYRPDSDLSRLNRAAPGVWVTVHPHMIKVLKAANQLYHESEGTFDIRCGGTLPHPNPLPTGEGGATRVRRGSQARKTGPWKLDLGGIAKGYAVDCAVEKIKTLGRGHGLSGIVNAGGDLRRWGRAWPPVAVATSAVRTAGTRDMLSSAIHVRMPEVQVITQPKAVSVLSRHCLWSDALTKVMLLAPLHIADRCLAQYQAKGFALK